MDYTDFLPLFARTEEQIRADWDAQVNSGLTVNDADWVDTRQGSMYYICTQSGVIEAARLWDGLTEAAAASNPATAWGSYLDAWAQTFGLTRDPATKATGTVTFNGTNGTIINAGVQIAVPQTNPDVDPPIFVTTASGTIASGTLDLPVEAVDAGVAGNVGAATITLLVSTLLGVTTITNAAATINGADEQGDDSLRSDITLALNPKSPGNVDDYIRWSLEYPGVGIATAVPVWSGAGSVLVTIGTVAGKPVATSVVTGLQANLDPTGGLGGGRAPIGATVTVKTFAEVTVNIAATITYKPGYSLTGTTGTVALQQEITDALNGYIDSLLPGQNVIFNAARAVIFDVPGVLDVTAFTLNGAGSNISIAVSPSPQVALMGTVTLS